MRTPRTRRVPVPLLGTAAAALLSLLPLSAWADSAVAVDTVMGNGLVPTGMDPGLRPAGSAIGTFRPGGSRSPSGLRYPALLATPTPNEGSDGWRYNLSFEAGVMGGDENLANPLFRRYGDPHNGVALSWFSLEADNPSDQRSFELTASNLGRDDQFIAAKFRSYDRYTIEAFINQIPHALGSGPNYFRGAGTDTLTLPPGLTPGANSLAAVAAAAAAGDPYNFQVQRNRAGIHGEWTLDSRWRVYAGYTLEQRKGSRPMGGAMFFPLNLGGAVVGGVDEIIEPIDQRSHEIVTRLQYASARTQFNLIGTVSLFENAYSSLTWENPFDVGSVVGPNPYAANLQRGQMALSPSNQAYNLKAELAHSVPEWAHARFSATVSVGRMQQNEALLAPSINATGIGGVPIPAPDMTWNYADWSTTAALSRQNADARIDTGLVDLKASFVPADRLTLRAGMRHQTTRNHTDYTAYNPITGQYGYLAMGGGQGTVIPLESGIYSPASPLWHYRSIPFDGSQTNFTAEADYRLRNTTTLNLSYERENYLRHHRERDRTWDDRIKLGVTERALGEGTLRASYEYANRRGSEYNPDPYSAYYTTSLPGAPDPGIPHTLDELRKFDIADRKQQTLNLRFQYPLAADIDAGLTLQQRRIDWGAQFGRVDRQRNDSVNLDLSWSPAEGTTGYAYYSQDRSRIAQANVNDNSATMVGGGNFGGVVYPVSNQWTADSVDRSHVIGLGLKKYFASGTGLDLSFTSTRARTSMGYGYVDAGGAVLGTPGAPLGDVGNAFPDLTYRLHSLQASVTVPLNQRLSVRLVGRHEVLRIADWHYDGLTPMLTSNTGGLLPVTFIDQGPRDYRASSVGVFLSYRL